MLTGEQLRAGRAILKLEQTELAELSGVSLDTIKRLERMEGALAANTRTLLKLQATLEKEGVVFLPDDGDLPGVRPRRDPPPNIRKRKQKGRVAER